MYILASIFFFLKTINTYLKLEIRVACREFLAFKYVVIVFFRNKTDDYSYLYIRNLENSHLKPRFMENFLLYNVGIHRNFHQNRFINECAWNKKLKSRNPVVPEFFSEI